MSTDKPSFSMFDCNKLQQKNPADSPMGRHSAGNNWKDWASALQVQADPENRPKTH